MLLVLEHQHPRLYYNKITSIPTSHLSWLIPLQCGWGFCSLVSNIKRKTCNDFFELIYYWSL